MKGSLRVEVGAKSSSSGPYEPLMRTQDQCFLVLMKFVMSSGLMQECDNEQGEDNVRTPNDSELGLDLIASALV